MTVWWSLVLYSLACTFIQNDLKRKLEQLTSEAAKTRRKFEDTLRRVKEEKREAELRQSQEALNKSTKAGKKKKKNYSIQDKEEHNCCQEENTV
jgi:ABC-type bacteriocin/lantibiotic exporter with double-glycine peptidase domain